MKRAYFLLSILFLSTAAQAVSGNRLLLIGDSITRGIGDSDYQGFRKMLSDSLAGIGYPFVYVGYYGPAPYVGHFNEGKRIGEFYPTALPGGEGTFDVFSTMMDFKPTIAVIHLGTNDAYDSGLAPSPYTADGGLHFTTHMSGKLAQLIRYLVRWNDGTYGSHLQTIFVCQIIPNKNLNWAYPGKIETYNADIDNIVADANSGNIPSIPAGILRLVDEFTGFDMDSMLLSDGTHPNAYGYAQMAHVLFQAFRTLPMHLEVAGPLVVHGSAGNVLDDSLAVLATDDFGNPAAAVEVRYQVTRGDAQVLGSATLETDAQGIASVCVRLGQEDTSAVRVTASGLSDSTVTFTVTASAYARLAGTVLYYSNGAPISGVLMEWKEEETAIDTTSAQGLFDCRSVLYGSQATLMPVKPRWEDVDPATLLTYDAALIARHVVGMDELSPEQLTAADVDGDGDAAMDDAVCIARSVVNLTTPGSGAGLWHFSPDSLFFASLSADHPDIEFTGYVSGDVHGGWSGASSGKADRFHQGLTVETCSPDAETFEIRIGVSEPGVLSCDLECVYPPEAIAFFGVNAEKEGCQVFFNRVREGAFRLGFFVLEPLPMHEPAVTFVFKKASMDHAWIGLNRIFLNDAQQESLLLDLDEEDDGPRQYVLAQNYPNPFNSATVIGYELPEGTWIRLAVYDASGRRVSLLYEGMQTAGRKEIAWEGKDSENRPLPSGVYYCRFESEGVRKTVKLDLVR